MKAWAAYGWLAAVLMLVVACDSGGSSDGALECPPLEVPASREEGAKALLDLVEDQREFARAELPAWELRHVFLPLGQGGPATFLYAPTPSKDTPSTVLSLDAGGTWQVWRDERARLPDNLAVLDLTSLRLGPETVAAAAESSVPGLSLGGLGLAPEDCELTWFVGGFVLGPDGQPREVVEGVVPDATGVFELRKREPAPGMR